MELYEYARPGLMAGKKILYVHGFASSGQNGSVRTLRLLMPRAQVLAPDLPVEPFDAMELLRNMVVSEKPDLIVGSSMGAMYAEMLYGVDRILVNPAFQLADTLLKNNGLGRQEFHNPRLDGETSFLVIKNPSGTFPGGQLRIASKGLRRTRTRFSDILSESADTLVHTFDQFSGHYPQAVRFDGEHYLNDEAILHSLLPVIQWIDDRQNGVQRPVLFISLSDRIINHSSGFHKAVATLAADYDIHIVAGVPYNNPELCQKVFGWCEENLGVPVWNRVTITNHKNLLLADYLIDAEPETNGGKDFMGTMIHFGSDAFKTWEDVLTFFARLGGQ